MNDDLTPEEEQELQRLEALEDKLSPEEENELRIYEEKENGGIKWTPPAQQLQGFLGSIQKGVGAASEFVDKYSYAPVRSAIAANQRMEDPAKAFSEQWGESPEFSPSATDIAAHTGLSREPSIPFGFRKIGGDQFKMSPAGIAGGIGGTIADPLTWIPGGVFKYPASMVSKFAPKLGMALETRAAEQAVKAATGGDVGSLRAALKTKRLQATDPRILAQREQQIGQSMLEADPAGGPAIRFGSRAEDIAPRLADKAAYFGQKVGEYDTFVDTKFPKGAFNTRGLADDILFMANSIPPVGVGANAQERLFQIAEQLENLGPITLAQARELKTTIFPFTPNDPVLSNKNLNSSLNQLIEHHIESTIDEHVGGLGLVPYDQAKAGLSNTKGVAQAATNKVGKGKVNRNIPLSSQILSGGILAGGIAAGETLSTMLMAAAALAANKIMLGRGNAAMASGLWKLAKLAKTSAKFANSPQAKMLAAASKKGSQGFLGAHHMLMNTDTEYRDLIENTDIDSTSNEEGEP